MSRMWRILVKRGAILTKVEGGTSTAVKREKRLARRVKESWLLAESVRFGEGEGDWQSARRGQGSQWKKRDNHKKVL